MAQAKVHIQALLKLPAEERAHAARLLLASLDYAASTARTITGMNDKPLADRDLLASLDHAASTAPKGRSRPPSSPEQPAEGPASALAQKTATYLPLELTAFRSTGSSEGDGSLESLESLESDDELADLDDLAADTAGLRAAVRAAVEAELEPLHELTRLLQRFAELARTTGHALRSRTA